jgi:hypothetical protein
MCLINNALVGKRTLTLLKMHGTTIKIMHLLFIVICLSETETMQVLTTSLLLIHCKHSLYNFQKQCDLIWLYEHLQISALNMKCCWIPVTSVTSKLHH